ncbi:hypothetical protein BV898_11894 [Hypsibius exemplaris]|uniref:Peptidase M12A domain-containing protein n=1 Tax=Hypsibius exemplaris TaxID=2072580 RepID=A0A1W0WFE1_HYPEX|nr:hypothetical protein BV898_11894 [Hypsibius exemplaris]
MAPSNNWRVTFGHGSFYSHNQFISHKGERRKRALAVWWIGYLIFILVSLWPTCRGGVFNSDPRYSLWPNPVRIPYQIQLNDLNAPDFGTLTAAMNQISSDTAGCIKFVPYDATIDRKSDFVLFRNRLSSGIIDICYTFPGMVANNGFGQVAVIFGTSSYPGVSSSSTVSGMPGACLDNQRETMRLLMNLLGVRNEHNRADRNKFLTFQSSNPNSLVVSGLDKYNLFGLYNGSTTIASTFDYQSVTLVAGEKFAASLNSPVFVPASGSKSNTIGHLARLSRTDCLVINMLYQCSAPCPDPYANAGGVTFRRPTTFTTHIYCAPLTATTSLASPIVIGDVIVTSTAAVGVAFQYTMSPQVSYLSVESIVLGGILAPGSPAVFADRPAARLLLTQIPTKGFINGQFTLTATGGTLTGTTTVTLTVNCLPQFVASTGGRPTFTAPESIAQPSTFGTLEDVFSITIGDSLAAEPALYVNCETTPPPKNNLPPLPGSPYTLPSSLGFVTATDPEGGRITYRIVAPFPEASFNKAYSVTPDGVILLETNELGTLGGSGQGNADTGVPYNGGLLSQADLYIAAVDPVGGVSVLHYKILYQCGPPR